MKIQETINAQLVRHFPYTIHAGMTLPLDDAVYRVTRINRVESLSNNRLQFDVELVVVDV